MTESKLPRRSFIRQGLVGTTVAGAASLGLNASSIARAIGAGDRINLGLIGGGHRGRFIIEQMAKGSGDNFALVAFSDIWTQRRESYPVEAEKILKIKPKAYADYRKLLEDTDVDAVVIATPDHQHAGQTIAGKHVYVEKPMTHSWEEGEAFIEAAEKSGKVLQVGSQYPSMGCAREAAELIKSGRLGQVTLIEGRIHRNTATGAWYYPIPPDASPETIDWKSFLGSAPPCDFDLRRFFQWRLFWDYSGGLPTDLFVHLITAVHQMMGVQEPESVVSFGGIYHWKEYREVPDQMTSLVRYPEGFVLQLTSTASNGHPAPILKIYGTAGTIEYNGDSFTYFYEPRGEGFAYSTHSWPEATVAEFKRRMKLNDRLQPIDGPAAAAPVEYKAPNDEDSTRAHLRNWIDAIRTGGKPIEDARAGHHAALVGHMCNLSYKSGKPVTWNRKTRKVEA